MVKIIIMHNYANVLTINQLKSLPKRHWRALMAGQFRGYWGSKQLEVMPEIQASNMISVMILTLIKSL